MQFPDACSIAGKKLLSAFCLFDYLAFQFFKETDRLFLLIPNAVLRILITLVASIKHALNTALHYLIENSKKLCTKALSYSVVPKTSLARNQCLSQMLLKNSRGRQTTRPLLLLLTRANSWAFSEGLGLVTFWLPLYPPSHVGQIKCNPPAIWMTNSECDPVGLCPPGWAKFQLECQSCQSRFGSTCRGEAARNTNAQ